MCICAVSASAATVNVSAAGGSSLVPLSAFRSGENTVTVLLLKTGENEEGSVSILLTDPSLGTGDESPSLHRRARHCRPWNNKP